MSVSILAADLARVLGGRRAGDGWLVRCPVPGHGRGDGDRRPSLLIKDGDASLLIHCFAGCDARAVLDVLRQHELQSEPEATRRPRPPATARARLDPDPRAIAIWRSAGRVADTLAERYLRLHRGLEPPFAPSLRFASVALHPRSRVAMPAFVAAVQGLAGNITAVQLTFLTSDGAKASLTEPRWTHGVLGEGAVRLGPPADALGIAEGVEDALAASQLSQLSCWACLGSGRMHRVHLPDEVREVHIFADDDEPGRKAAERTAARHQDLGRRVVVRLPPDGFKDWGEVASRSRGERAAA